MLNKFDVSKLKGGVENPLVGLENVSTDAITNYVLGNKKYRFNFYVLIQYYFNKYRDELLSGNYEQYKNDVNLMFKGGNIIKSVIDLSEQNLIKIIPSS